MKIIQLRGVNGVGKTTIVRDFIEKGNFSVGEQQIGAKQYSYCFDGKIAIIGRYDARETGGVDGMISDKAVLKEVIAQMARALSPDYLIFEGVMYGITFQFSYDISLWAKAKGYEYEAICLMPCFDVAMLRVWERNGGKAVNVERLEDKYMRAANANKKLKAKGVNCRVVDTGGVERKDMYKILEASVAEKR